MVVRSGESGALEAQALKWKDTLKEAAGSMVKDDPTKLRKALKRREQQKNKSAKTWGKILKQEQIQKVSGTERARAEGGLRRG